MDLEQRVKTLEYEMKILKNEIQRTLLDIQEQVLVHYYPALRTEEAVPTDGIVQAVEAIRAKQVTAPAPSAAAPISVVPLAPVPVAPPPLPIVKKVSLDEIRAAHTQPVVAPQVPDQIRMLKLMEWAMACAAKIGGKRTGEVIEICHQRGFLTADLREVLVRIAAFNRGITAASVPTNEVLAELLKLAELSCHPSAPDDALTWMEEASIG
ncbi:MAG: hypothetical protein A2Z03_05885 [Chloroflexi bacterium RBG_16_56_8]|nr:MAG: hypothetical protein A2Z03_05885 [Chloroflexi bacterium RBG_16_56_8]